MDSAFQTYATIFNKHAQVLTALGNEQGDMRNDQIYVTGLNIREVRNNYILVVCQRT